MSLSVSRGNILRTFQAGRKANPAFAEPKDLDLARRRLRALRNDAEVSGAVRTKRTLDEIFYSNAARRLLVGGSACFRYRTCPVAEDPSDTGRETTEVSCTR